MKLYWLCFASVFIFSLFSCNNSGREIKIHWELLCDISGVDFTKTPVELKFSNGHRDRIYKLIPNKTETINLEEDMYLFGQAWPGGLMLYIYPDIHANGINSKDEDRFRKHNAMEVFLYNPEPVKESEDSITMMPHEKILAYQYYLYRDDTIYVIVSQNNDINKNIDTIPEISVPEGTSLDKTLDFMIENNLDECFYIPKLAFYSDNMDAYGGLIVNSRFSDTGIILIPPYGN